MGDTVRQIKSNLKKIKNSLAIMSNSRLKASVKAWNEDRALADNPYNTWLACEDRTETKGKNKPGVGESILQLPAGQKIVIHRDWDYVLVIAEDVELNPGICDIAEEYAYEVSARDEELPGLIYGDEDIILIDGEKKDRVFPYFKPEYSPETLLAAPYMGGMLLVRADILSDCLSVLKEREEWPKECHPSDNLLVVSGIEDIYELALEITTRSIEVLHISRVLSHRVVQVTDENRNSIDANLIYHPQNKRMQAAAHRARNARHFVSLKGLRSNMIISVVIPSKDHPEILRTCVQSLVEKTKAFTLDIIVVDNGSNEEAKNAYEAMASEYGFKYFYEPMEFNYSKMNNIGVEKAVGDLVLLLNDDTEIIGEESLALMASYCIHPEIGAVGAKLLYANTDLIQHVGVTNLPVGPSHKLVGKPDDEVYYYGRNTLDMNVLAVTGACLMIERKKLIEVGGLNEEMRVAYNDIDLCFKLYEAGYRNVQCNSAVLYHYESLTRGADAKGTDKWERLTAEREKLYSLHPWARGYDPYYNFNLIENSVDFIPTIKNIETYYTDVDAFDNQEVAESQQIIAGIDRAVPVLTGTDTDYYWIEGWGFMSGSDNRKYSLSVVLKGERDYELIPVRTLREDVAEFFRDEQYISMAGFFAKIKASGLECPPDGLRVYIMLTDKVSGLKSIKETELVISENMSPVENGM